MVKEKRVVFVTLSFFSGTARDRHNLEIYEILFMSLILQTYPE